MGFAQQTYHSTHSYGTCAPVATPCSVIAALPYQGSRLKHGPMHTACRECLTPSAHLDAFSMTATLHLTDTLRSLLSLEGMSWMHLITLLILPPRRMSGCLRLLPVALADGSNI